MVINSVFFISQLKAVKYEGKLRIFKLLNTYGI